MNRINSDTSQIPLERHPFPPYVPHNAKVLIMGTFPPQPKRWAMNFYYPNRTNDFWPMMGLIFCGDRRALLNPDGKTFNLNQIKSLLNQYGIAMSDTGFEVRRLMDNASDKYLEIVTPAPLHKLLDRMPLCRAIATTGEKAADVIASLTHTQPPGMGKMVPISDTISHWRMPSTSRAYPLPLEQKAAYYAEMFRHSGLL